MRLNYVKGIFVLMMITAILNQFWGCSSKPIPKQKTATPTMFKYATTPPDSTTNILFIHHSVGGNWAADFGQYVEMPGTEKGSNIYVSHENGGGLRTALQSIKTQTGTPAYELHEVARKSTIGAKTDVCHWYSKFTQYFDRPDSNALDMLNVALQDSMYPDNQMNKIIMFKSCYPNSDVNPGEPTTKPLTDPKMTIGNYKAVYTALLNDVFRPERMGENRTLFIAVTAPPRSKKDCNEKQAAVAREFNNWLRTEWLTEKDSNVAVFDYFNINTGGIGNDLDSSWVQGKVNYSAYLKTSDSHPNSEAQSLATQEFLRFINLAYNRWFGRLNTTTAEQDDFTTQPDSSRTDI